MILATFEPGSAWASPRAPLRLPPPKGPPPPVAVGRRAHDLGDLRTELCLRFAEVASSGLSRLLGNRTLRRGLGRARLPLLRLPLLVGLASVKHHRHDHRSQK